MVVREIPWRQPVLLRNRIVHGYGSIDLGILLATAPNQLPGFVASFELSATHSTTTATATMRTPTDPAPAAAPPSRRASHRR